MSVILLGDGTITSSKAFYSSPFTLPDPAASPHIVRDNIDVIEGDGGCDVMYEKGTYQRIFPYRFTLVSNDIKEQIDRWWKNMEGRLNWFILQTPEQLITSEFTQEYTGGSNYIIENTLLKTGHLTHWWRGYWVIVKDGAAQGQKRKIIKFYGTPYGHLYADPVFDNIVAVGDTVVLGYPVKLDEQDIQFIPRIPNFWDVNITFKEHLLS